MDHEHLLKQGKLDDCLSSIQNKIRSDASNVKHRIFLFQLLLILGEWNRAEKQLDVIAKMDPITIAMVLEYRAAIKSEVCREAVFSGIENPVFMGKPDEWQALILQSVKSFANDKEQEAQKLLETALEIAPTSSGTLNGESFEWIADADSRLGPLLEVFVDGEYRWVPFTNIKRIAIEVPENLRDFVWVPAHIQWTTEGESFVLIPTRYPFSAKQDNLLALSRKTEWIETVENCYLGYGQRLLVTDKQDYSLLDVRDILFETNKE